MALSWGATTTIRPRQTSRGTARAQQAPARVFIHHPLAAHLVLRTSTDWHRVLQPVALSNDGTTAEFQMARSEGASLGKACLRVGKHELWATGGDVLLSGQTKQEMHPHFAPTAQGSITARLEAPGQPPFGPHAIRLYLPPDYWANPQRRYPVLYMQDGANLFLPEESFVGHTWQVPQTMDLLIGLGLISPAIVVGIYPASRMEEYTRPGYDRYGRWLVEELKPAMDAQYRTKPDRDATFVMGSSLGGVVSLHLAWQWPGVFAGAACLSSTFGWRDDLGPRVTRQAQRPVRLYIDNGGPGDNSQTGRRMADLLTRRGYRQGQDLLYQSFAKARHSEVDWAARLHHPLRFLLGEEQTGYNSYRDKSQMV